VTAGPPARMVEPPTSMALAEGRMVAVWVPMVRRAGRGVVMGVGLKAVMEAARAEPRA